MRVVRNETPNDPADGASGASATTPATRVTIQPTAATPPEETTAETQKPSAPGESQNVPVPGETLQANVTFRRDDQGQIYYVLTDAESGKEIREVPPAEIRKVGKGIADYLKQEATKGSSRVKTEA